MEFSLDRFYRMNRRAIIWLVLFALLYFLRDFLLLMFLTFIIGFFAFPAAHFLMEKLRLSRGFSITLVYAAILLTYVMTVWWVAPSLIEEAGKLNAQVPDIKLKLNELREEYSQRYPQLAGLVESYIPEQGGVLVKGNGDEEVRRMLEEILARLDEDAADGGEAETGERLAGLTAPAAGEDDRGLPAGVPEATGEAGAAGVGVPAPRGRDFPEEPGAAPATPRELPSDIELDGATGPSYIDREIDRWTAEIRGVLAASSARVVRFVMQSLLAILFSYLIMLEFGRLTKELSGLRSSKLRDFYEEAGQPVVSFALSVGKGFQAIVIIAFITMLMLGVFLLVFRIPQVVLLSLIIFLTSLVPIVGVVFEALAILLVTFNAYGLGFQFWAMVAAIIVVHLLIGYLIGPVIFGRQFRMNMVLILIILYIAQRIGGMWGLILGVPIANYFIRDVFAVPFIEEKEAARKTRAIEIKTEDAPSPASSE